MRSPGWTDPAAQTWINLAERRSHPWRRGENAACAENRHMTCGPWIRWRGSALGSPSALTSIGSQHTVSDTPRGELVGRTDADYARANRFVCPSDWVAHSLLCAASGGYAAPERTGRHPASLAAIKMRAHASASDAAWWCRNEIPSRSQTSGSRVGRMFHTRRATVTVQTNGCGTGGRP